MHNIFSDLHLPIKLGIMGRKLNAILRFSNFQDVALPEAAFAQKFSRQKYTG